jgi:hypothetical protein
MGLQFQAAWLEREGTHTRRRLSFDSGPKWADIVPE